MKKQILESLNEELNRAKEKEAMNEKNFLYSCKDDSCSKTTVARLKRYYDESSSEVNTWIKAINIVEEAYARN